MDEIEAVIPEASSSDTFLDAYDDPDHISSSFVYGAKPSWGWDYCLIFKIPHALRAQLSPRGEAQLNDQALDKGRALEKQRADILARLKSAGFSFSQLVVPSEAVIVLRLALPEAALKDKAVRLGLELRLRKEYGGGFIAYTPELDQSFENAQAEHYFGPADRTMILLSALQCKAHWGCGLNIERLLYEGVVVQAFAVHATERDALVSAVVWRRWWDPTFVPDFTKLKDYLGARVTLYFVFVSFYARSLLLIAMLSIPIYIVYRVVLNSKVVAILRWTFSVGLVLWTTVFLERWKRRNASVALTWGLDDYREDAADDTRAQFVGDMRYGFYCDGGFVPLADLVESDTEEKQISSEDIPRNPFQDIKDARRLRAQSLAVSAVFVLLVGGVTFLLLWFRNEIVNYFEDGGYKWANAAPGVANGIIIFVFDSVWRSVSLILTRRENHRTNQEFENSLVCKRFAFQFISNYISLFYIAFVRPYLKETCPTSTITNKPDCMRELENQLMSLVITRATIGQVTEIGVPFVLSTFKQWFARSKEASPRTPTSAVPQKVFSSSANNRYILESKLAPYDSTLEDYGELVLQFGYVALFGLAFPPAALVALLNNLIEGRTDAYKVLVLSQRVVADDAADIGAWYGILQFLNVLSVITNAGLVVFTADAAGLVFNFDSAPGGAWRQVLYRVVAFFCMEHVLLGTKAAAAFLIPDMSSKSKRRAARRRYDVARWFGQGWKDAYRGNALLVVDEKEADVCRRFVDLFEVASEDEERLR